MPVIFDMDGVVSDTQSIHSRIECQMLAELGIAITEAEVTRRFAGSSLKEQFVTLFVENGLVCPDLDELTKRKRELFYACSAEFVAIEGTREVIRQLQSRERIALASGSSLITIDRVLTRIGMLDAFAVIASAEEVPRGKPAPDVFLLAAERLGAHPRDCVVIEDAVNGMIAAREAGMRCIALAPDPSQELPADLVVQDLREVPIELFLRPW